MSYKDLDLGSDDSIYLKLQDGLNRIRIVSEAIPVWTYFNREEKSATKWLEESIAVHPDAKKRFALWCIDRADGKTKMAEFGVQIMQQIGRLANDPDFGFDSDVAPYDMKILREGSALNTEYTVTPSPAQPLTEEEMARVVGLEKVRDFMAKQKGVITSTPVIETDAPPF